MRWVVVVFAAACGSKAPSPAPVAKAPLPTPTPPLPACIQPLEDSTVAITHATADGAQVKYCVGANSDQCFALETTSGKFEKLAEPPKHTEASNARVETTNPDLKVCQVDQCKTLTAKVLPAMSQIRGATNATGSVAVFLLGDAQAGKGYAEVWDVAGQKKVATFKYARGDFKCGDVAIIDDTIYVSAATCGAPAARAALYSIKGKKIANVGGNADYGVFGNAYASVQDKQWAFLEENGAQIVVQDLVKGKVLKKIDTSALFKENGGAAMGNPGESALLSLGPGKLAVIGGAPATGHVALVDVASGGVKVIKATICGAPPPEPTPAAPTPAAPAPATPTPAAL
ncbi:MAG: hypothetical protein M4D80_32055 [Myxococcota bacterium]|nr:hypothetical protein [Deltaproteobacteria bacterium]MDQ3339818.1 hypothetical protein [Myxococcota bacterium]